MSYIIFIELILRISSITLTHHLVRPFGCFVQLIVDLGLDSLLLPEWFDEVD